MPQYLRMSASVGIRSNEEITPPQPPTAPAEENKDEESEP